MPDNDTEDQQVPEGTAPEAPVIIYADGSCIGNPGPGGWGATISRGDRYKEFSGSVPEKTTSSRMELTAAIEALKKLKKQPLPVRLHSDSSYLINGATAWSPMWKARRWVNVANADLWKQIDRLKAKHKVEWIWVRGHDGNKGNERADYLAKQAANKAALK